MSVAQTLSNAKRLARSGAPEQAGQLYRSILDDFPANKRAQQGLADLKRTQQTDAGAAADSQDTVLQDLVKGLTGLYQKGRFDVVVEQASRLVEHFPVAILYNLTGASLVGLSRLEDAAEAFRKALAITPDDGELHKNIGTVYRDLAQAEKAAESLNRSLELLPGDADVWVLLGFVLTSLGRTEQAIAAFEQACELKPNLASAYGGLSNLKDFQPEDPQVGKMRSLLLQPSLSNKDRAKLCSALGRITEKQGHYAEAFDFFAQRNRVHKETQHFDYAFERTIFDIVRGGFPQSFSLAASAPGSAAPALPYVSIPDEKTPVFILGMPRSGTSLVEQILSCHSQIFGGGELAFMGKAVEKTGLDNRLFDAGRAQVLRGSYLAGLNKFDTREPLVTDKMPHNFRWVGHILSAFPEAKIIHMQRDPRAVCWSIFKSSFSVEKHTYAQDLNDLVAYYDLYLEWMAHWEQVFPGRIRHQSYEELTRNQEQQSRELVDWVGLTWEEQCLQFHRSRRAVKTVSTAQVRQPMYQGSSEKWRRYEEFLTPLTDRFGTGEQPENPFTPKQ
ncbi:tetratricopeptide repeat-containing sulfotransferase family protein [Candidatus Halocynthiibacter alkanivorans]|uniref:tetratricopeptide repeat-containing sulfotransferase family protein n=1 Tax=Candidatus Halocynthiibacter alkanivorans TaxID=2267619 RepID=UPI0013579AFB|nr:sulfotransferase [Candidatus Halocynthiibacter alkanivorans]